ncbi:MAG TPA: GNAT family N-acetyltransferase [Gaiellaceae bacterium]|nr:GNAT family N-acetyltransferase [Gaiellaceae bacterium]
MTRLVLLDESHLPALEPVVNDPETVRFTRIPEPVSPGGARRMLEQAVTGRRDGNREAFAIVDDYGEFLGIAVAPTINRDTLTAELGYMVAAAARGRGVATEGLRQLTEWAFGEGMLRLELLISVDNGASKKVAERCGYTREGVLRSTYLKPGRREDTEIWSRLVSD